MRAGLRLAVAFLGAGLMIGPAPSLAQSVPPGSGAPTTNTPATDAVGPRDLQNFSLKGTVTRPAPQQPETPPLSAGNAATGAPAANAPRQATASVAARPKPPLRTATAEVLPTPGPVARPSEVLRQTPPGSSVTVALPALGRNAVGSSTAAATPSGIVAAPAPSGTPISGRDLPFLPWLLAALALAAGGAFLLWRNRSREAFAGGPRQDAFVAPQPARAPVPAPPRSKPPAAPPRQLAEPSVPGTVTTRLRPWIEIGFHPDRFVVEDERVTIDFELELFNSGSAPARGVLLEATLFNAGTGQDEQIGAFFANPVGEGQRIVTIPPLKRMTIKSQVAVARDHVQIFEVAGRKVCVPLIALNALYSWSGGGEGQTSVSYLLGRDTQSDKMAPFRLDLGPRLFRGVGARTLPSGLRT